MKTMLVLVVALLVCGCATVTPREKTCETRYDFVGTDFERMSGSTLTRCEQAVAPRRCGPASGCV